MESWKPYHKIQSNLDFSCSKKVERQLNRVQWVVTEKVHGANFSILTNGTQTSFAKRTTVLNEIDEFYDYSSIIDELNLFSNLIWNQIEDQYNHLGRPTLLTVFGELFGGKYPHPNILSSSVGHPIQHGIWYSPTIKFMAFDIRIKIENTSRWFSYSEFQSIVEPILSHSSTLHSILFSRPLHIGTRNQAFNYPLDFSSTIPSLLNLPPLSQPTLLTTKSKEKSKNPPSRQEIVNLAEGVVVRPLHCLSLPAEESAEECGDWIPGWGRPIFKIKHKRFSEIVEASEALVLPSASLSRALQPFLRRLAPCRLDAAVSKLGPSSLFGPPPSSSFPSVLEEMLFEDVVEDLCGFGGREKGGEGGGEEADGATWFASLNFEQIEECRKAVREFVLSERDRRLQLT